MRSVLDKPTDPSKAMLLPIELEKAVVCACGHFFVDRNARCYWYWQTHSLGGCTLELPDVVCWCGLKRSEHIDGHNWSAQEIRG